MPRIRFATIALVFMLAGCSAGASDGAANNKSPSTGAGGNGAVNAAGSAGGSRGALMSSGSSTSIGGDTFVTPIIQKEAGPVKCGGIVNRGEQLPLDLFLMYDKSLSMTCQITNGGASRWQTVGDALHGFVTAPEADGIGVGIGYFGNAGLNSSCTPADYQQAAVEIAPLPANAGPIISSLTSQNPDTNTPTPAALQGALLHAKDWKTSHPGHTVAVVLVTDGQPNACGTGGQGAPVVPDVAAAATNGLSQDGIKTYVIGIISPSAQCGFDPNPPNQADLDTVAKAGGSDTAFMVDVSTDASKKFLDAMNKIRVGAQIPCSYQVPEPEPGTGKLNPDKVNVHFTPPNGTETTIFGVDQAACDNSGGGWFYNGDKTTINLCPVTCNQVTSQTGGQIDISVGCDTEHPPT